MPGTGQQTLRIHIYSVAVSHAFDSPDTVCVRALCYPLTLVNMAASALVPAFFLHLKCCAPSLHFVFDIHEFLYLVQC